jgi:hypothetical protein
MISEAGKMNSPETGSARMSTNPFGPAGPKKPRSPKPSHVVAGTVSSELTPAQLEQFGYL